MNAPIEIKRETEFYQGFIRLKMSVSNKDPSVITDVSLDFLYEDDLLRVDRHEPSYEIKNGKILLGNINGSMSKAIAVYFDPLMCTKGAEINCQVTFRDSKGKISSVFMEPKLVSVVCPILKTDLDINIGRLKEFIEKLQSKDSKVYEIHHSFNIDKLALIAREVVEKRHVRHVRSLKTKDGKAWEIWYYGKTKVKNADIVIKVSISSEKQLLELFAATENDEALTGLLAELGRDLKQIIEARVAGQGNVINLTIKDSFVQRSSLLDFCDMSGRCSPNIVVEDSVVQHSSLASWGGYVEPNKDNELSMCEIEGPESLRKKREELELLKAEMEELRRQREEKENKKKEKEGCLRKNTDGNVEDSGLPGIDMLFGPESNREEAEKKKNLKGHEELSKKQNKEKAERSRDEQEMLKKQRAEDKRGFRGKLQRKNIDQVKKVSAAKQTTEPPAQKNDLSKKSGSSPGIEIPVFTIIFGILLIGAVGTFLDLNGDSKDIYQEIPPIPATPSENNEKDPPDVIAKSSSAQSEPSQNPDAYTNSIGMEFLKVTAGEFMMGSLSDEKGRSGNEGSVHKVTIEDSYYLGKYEVTQNQWEEVMGSNPSSFKGDAHPVEKISWNDVQKFIEKLNEMEGTDKYRLPSEAEWEYACRAGTTTRYSFGDDDSELGIYAWYKGNSGDKTHPVGQKKPNPWGFYDMYGNVGEWCQDMWHSGYDGAPPDGSAWESESSSGRVLRGGNWYDFSRHCRSARRFSSFSGSRDSLVGFRLLRNI